MRELPSRGRCHAAFLLAHSAVVRPCRTVDEWVAMAASRSTFMAAASDIAGMADILLNADLVRHEETLVVGRSLARFSVTADSTSFLGIAALLLKRFPPGWIVSVVVEGEVIQELIPAGAMRALGWLKQDIVPLILEVHAALTRSNDDSDRKLLGDAGELAIMAALLAKGHAPVHVALVSDSYGYDIENARPAQTDRLEVKSCVQSTSDRLFISRNEFDKARLFGASWRLIQITFSSSVILNRKATKLDVFRIRELSGEALHALAPFPSSQFKWLESAEFRPQSAAWITSSLQVPENFDVKFEALDSDR